MQPSTDSDLVRRVQQGESRAFAELYYRYKRNIYEYCFRLLQEKDNADDALQNTFIKVYEKIGELKNSASFKAWLFTIARNEVYSLFRKARNNGSLDDEDVFDPSSPHEEAVQQEQTELVQKFLAQLKPTYREVLILLEYEQLSYAEIASVTDVSVSSVESMIFRARRALAKKLKPYYS